jgi:urease accessory protein
LTTITDILPAGAWAGEAADSVTLDYDGRHRRRIVLTGASGAEYLLDLAEATHLKDGDGLAIPGGGVVRVVAQAEPLLEITARTPAELTRLAWHIGNRHLAGAGGGRPHPDFAATMSSPIAGAPGRAGARGDGGVDPEGGAYQGHDHAH